MNENFINIFGKKFPKKYILIGVMGIAVIVAIAGYIFISSSPELILKNQTFEYGTKVTIDAKSFVDENESKNIELNTLKVDSDLMSNSKKYTYDTKTKTVTSKDLDYLEIGTYDITISTEDGKLSGNTLLEVKDTKGPTFTKSTGTITASSSVDYSTYFEAEDLSGATLTYDDSKVDLKTPGSYTLIVTAKDKYGNKTDKKATVVVSKQSSLKDNYSVDEILTLFDNKEEAYIYFYNNCQNYSNCAWCEPTQKILDEVIEEENIGVYKCKTRDDNGNYTYDDATANKLTNYLGSELLIDNRVSIPLFMHIKDGKVISYYMSTCDIRNSACPIALTSDETAYVKQCYINVVNGVANNQSTSPTIDTRTSNTTENNESTSQNSTATEYNRRDPVESGNLKFDAYIDFKENESTTSISLYIKNDSTSDLEEIIQGTLDETTESTGITEKNKYIGKKYVSADGDWKVIYISLENKRILDETTYVHFTFEFEGKTYVALVDKYGIKAFG